MAEEKKILFLSDHQQIYERTRAVIEETCAEWIGRIDWRSSTPDSILDPVNVNTDCEQLIANYRLVLSLHCNAIFPSSLVEAVTCVNLHPGFNPHNRGYYPNVFAILNGKTAGATLHVIDAQIDHGAIIDQIEVPVEMHEVASDVYKNIQDAEIELFRRNVHLILNDNFTSTPTTMEGNLNYKRDFEGMREIDLDRVDSFGNFLNHLRAMTFGEMRNTFFLDETGRKVYVRIKLDPDVSD